MLLDGGRTDVLADEVGRVGAALHPLLGLPERLPGLRARRRPGLRVRLSGADRRDPDAAAARAGRGAVAAVGVVAVRRLLRGLPGQDRHPLRPGAPARARRARGEVAARARGAGDEGHGRARSRRGGATRPRSASRGWAAGRWPRRRSRAGPRCATSRSRRRRRSATGGSTASRARRRRATRSWAVTSTAAGAAPDAAPPPPDAASPPPRRGLAAARRGLTAAGDAHVSAAKADILARIRGALGPSPAVPDVPRAYRAAGSITHRRDRRPVLRAGRGVPRDRPPRRCRAEIVPDAPRRRRVSASPAAFADLGIGSSTTTGSRRRARHARRRRHRLRARDRRHGHDRARLRPALRPPRADARPRPPRLHRRGARDRALGARRRRPARRGRRRGPPDHVRLRPVGHVRHRARPRRGRPRPARARRHRDPVRTDSRADRASTASSNQRSTRQKPSVTLKHQQQVARRARRRPRSATGTSRIRPTKIASHSMISSTAPARCDPALAAPCRRAVRWLPSGVGDETDEGHTSEATPTRLFAYKALVTGW